jgi:hypothetical protein
MMIESSLWMFDTFFGGIPRIAHLFDFGVILT